MKKHVMLILGTRPEAIKMCPIVNQLKKRPKFNTTVCVTGQHREMLDEVLALFSVIPDYDLSIMKDQQTLFDITELVVRGIKDIASRVRPDAVLVHGDTTTAFAASLACFYLKIPVCHVEAGLRTGDRFVPFPEEFNRRAVSQMASYHFAPTETAKRNLLREGIPEKTVFVTGNTVVDALSETVRADFCHPLLTWCGAQRLILLTAHRRESIGKPIEDAFRAIRMVLDGREDAKAIFPLHKNPSVRKIACEAFADCPRIALTEPLGALEFHNLMARCYLILTDSGGIQEEATVLGKPVLVLRNDTERPEGIESGNLRLVGTEKSAIETALKRLLDDPAAYAAMSKKSAPFGDGRASERIADILEDLLFKKF